VRWAAETGGATEGVVEAILASRPHPQQGFRSCLGLLRLGKRYSPERLEAACRRALVIGSASYKSVQSILKTGLDSQPLPVPETPETPPIEHPNIRGTLYYEHREKEIPSC
jgi:transposase